MRTLKADVTPERTAELLAVRDTCKHERPPEGYGGCFCVKADNQLAQDSRAIAEAYIDTSAIADRQRSMLLQVQHWLAQADCVGAWKVWSRVDKFLNPTTR